MAKLALISDQGTLVRKLDCTTRVPEDLVIPKGYLLSWEDQPSSAPGWYKETSLRAPEKIRHKEAIAILTNYHPTVHIRIESSVPEDLFELIDMVILHIGGTIIPAQLPINNAPSFTAGIKGDLQRLKNHIAATLTRIKQRFGMKLASL